MEDSSGHYVVRDGSLIIQGVQESDAGSYMCTASNSEGSESMEVRLTVSAPLSVHVQPSIQTVDLGKVAHLVIDDVCTLYLIYVNRSEMETNGLGVSIGHREIEIYARI